MTTGHIDHRYGQASAAAPPWEDIEQRLVDSQLYWLVTVRADGRPHAVPLVGVWHDVGFSFCTGAEEQKMRNLEAHDQVIVTAGPLGADGWADGKDVAVEGTVARVTDPAELQRLADAWYAKYGDDWHWRVEDGAFRASGDQDSGSGGPALVFRVTPAKVLVFGDDHGQTRYRP